MTSLKRQKTKRLLVFRRKQITRKRRLAEREFILSQTQKLAKTGSWEFDRHTQTTRWSNEMYNIHGLHTDFDTNNYNAVLELYEESSRGLFIDAAQKLFENSEPFDITARIVTPLGHIKWVRVLAHPVIRQDEVTGIVGITADITAVKEAERLLRASEEKFERAFHNSADMMVLMREEDMLVLDVNEKAFTMLGYTRDELIGKVSPGTRFYHNPADRERLLMMYFANGSAEIECSFVKKTGELLPVVVNAMRVEADGRYFFLIRVRDISARKIVEALHLQSSGNAEAQSPLQQRLAQLMDQWAILHDAPSSKLVVPTAEGLLFIRPKTIVYCEADSNYTRVYLADGKKHTISKTLKEFEALLPAEFFFRIHNSYVVNITFIKRYDKGTGTLVMEDETTLDVSKRRKESFLDRIGARKNP